jgi:hypothetical protein
MSHHLSGPNLRSPADDARLDLTDLFAFPAAGGYRTVLIMNRNLDFGGSADAFHPQAVYRSNLDTDADNQADVAFSVVFSDPADGPQTFTVHRATGDQAHTQEATGEVIASDVPVSLGPEPQIVQAGPYRVFAGLPPGRLPQRPRPHRRRAGCPPGHGDQRQGRRRPDRPSHRPAGRLPLPRPSAPLALDRRERRQR